MNKTIVEQFIAALRSGEYKQTFGSLRQGDCYCAQGVLCDTLVRNGQGKWHGVVFEDEYGGAYRSSLSSYKITNIFGKNVSLVHYNDIKHMSFPEIADAVCKELGL